MMDIDGLVNDHESSALHIVDPNSFTLSSTNNIGGPSSSISPSTTRELADFVFPSLPSADNDLTSTRDTLQTRKRASTDTHNLPDLSILGPLPPGRKKSQPKADSTNRMSSSKDYPRRRALQACQICRARKTKCDNERPSCGSCEALGVECNYNEAPASKYSKCWIK